MNNIMTSPWFVIDKMNGIVVDGNLVQRRVIFISLTPTDDVGNPSRIGQISDPALAHYVVRLHNQALAARAAERDKADPVTLEDQGLAAALRSMSNLHKPREGQQKMLKTTVRMDEELTLFLRALANRHETSMSKLVRLAVQKAFSKQLAWLS